MSDPALTAEQEAADAAFEAEVERRLAQRQAAAEAEAAARRQAEAEARGAALPAPAGADTSSDRPGWYPMPAPIEEDIERRIFPRGTSASEVLEYDRMEAERRLAEQGMDRPPAPLPEGTITASAAEFGLGTAGALR